MIPWISLVSFLKRFTTTPFLHPRGVYSFSHLQLYSLNVTIIMACPPHLRNYFTISSAPAVFLLLSLATHSFTFSPVHSLSAFLVVIFPYGCLYICPCPRVDYFVKFASDLLLGLGVPSVRFCSSCASLLPFELLMISPFYAPSVAVPLFVSRARLPSIPSIPIHICFIPLSNYLFVL